MTRVLVFGLTENPGGVESFLVTYFRFIDKNRIHFDFLCNTLNKVAYEDELSAAGAGFFHIHSRSESPALFKKELYALFSEHSCEWDAIWVNVCSLANIDYLKAAKRFGISRRIIHSHNSQNMDSRLRGILHRVNRCILDRYATDFWACSRSAAEWFYNRRIIDKAVIINNAIDVESMAFDESKRKSVRAELNIPDSCTVIGNIGRLHFQKNQSFAIDVFNEYLKINQDSVLIFVGGGDDEAMLRAKCAGLELQGKVIFAGVQSDIQAWLSAFDVFLFPSLFEGLSVVAMEAQANGLPVLASEGVIPKEVMINENFKFVSIEEPIEKWVESLCSIQKRIDSIEIIKKSFAIKGFDVTTETQKLSILFT